MRPGQSTSGGTEGSSTRETLKRKLPVPSLGWKDALGKDHMAHTMRYRFLTRISDIFWQLLDRLVVSTEQSQGAPPASEFVREVNLANLVEREARRDGRHFLGAAAVSTDSRTARNGAQRAQRVGLFPLRETVIDAFCGTESGGAERSLGLFSQLDVAVKRVQKLSVNQRVVVGSTSVGFPARGAPSGGRRGGRSSGARRPSCPHNIRHCSSCHQALEHTGQISLTP